MVTRWEELGGDPPLDAFQRQPPRLRSEGLSVAYGGRTVLAPIDLDIEAGKIMAVVGPSGSGKTSFLMAINRLTDLIPRCRVSGNAWLDDISIRDSGLGVRGLRRRVGMIFQQANPFPFSIRRNVLIGLREHCCGRRDEYDAAMETSLRHVGLWDEVKDRLDHPALSLSGGQQQRLCLARALALQPNVLLLDEPCSALDPLATSVIEELLLRLRGRLTIVIVTHNLAQASRVADDVALFWIKGGAGYLAEAGPAKKIFAHPESAVAQAYVEGRAG